MRRTVIGLVIALVVGLACKGQGGSTTPAPQPQPQQNHDNGNNNNEPNPRVNEPGPAAADPSAHPLGGIAELKATWKSQTKKTPHIEYDPGTGQQPAGNLKSSRLRDGSYNGFWVVDVVVQSGQTVGMTMYGTPSFTYASCMIVYKGQIVSPQATTRNCASSYTIP